MLLGNVQQSQKFQANSSTCLTLVSVIEAGMDKANMTGREWDAQFTFTSCHQKVNARIRRFLLNIAYWQSCRDCECQYGS